MLVYVEYLACMPLGRSERQLMIWILAYQRHVPVHWSCDKHHVRGVWGAAGPPSGERDGYPLGVEPARSLAQDEEREGSGH